MKLLLIDRDRDLVEMLSGWLKMRGYGVQRAYTVEQAETIWKEQRPDLVLVDTDHPDADMLKFCQQLRYQHDAMVMVMTASKDVQDEVRCLEAGADDYLRKPFFPAQLIARLRALSRRTRSRQAGAAQATAPSASTTSAASIANRSQPLPSAARNTCIRVSYMAFTLLPAPARPPPPPSTRAGP